jgi:hypothetical protein
MLTQTSQSEPVFTESPLANSRVFRPRNWSIEQSACPACNDRLRAYAVVPRRAHFTLHVTAASNTTSAAGARAAFDYFRAETANAGRVGNKCGRHMRCSTFYFHSERDREAFLTFVAGCGLQGFLTELVRSYE